MSGWRQLSTWVSEIVANIERLTTTTTSAAGKLIGFMPLGVVDDFTAHPFPPRTVRAIETVPPVRDEYEEVAASGFSRRRTVKEASRFSSKVEVFRGSKQPNSDCRQLVGDERVQNSGRRHGKQDTQQIRTISTVRQQTVIARQRRVNMDRDVSEDEDAGQLSIGEIRAQYEELLRGRVQAEENYAQMTTSAAMEAETRQQLEHRRGLRGHAAESDDEEAEQPAELAVEISDDESVSNEETRQQRRERIEAKYWATQAETYPCAAVAPWNPLRQKWNLLRKTEREEAEKLCKIIDNDQNSDPEREKQDYARAQIAIACVSVMADSLALKLSNNDPDSVYEGVAEHEEHKDREFAVSNPMCIPPIYGIPGWPAEFVQFEIETGPLDVFELDDLRVKPGYVFDQKGRVKERSDEQQMDDEQRAETRWMQALRVYYKPEGGLVGTANALFNQTMAQGQAAAMFTDASLETTSGAGWAICQFVSLGHLAEFVCSHSVIQRGDIKQTCCVFQPEWMEGSLAQILRCSERAAYRYALVSHPANLGSRARQSWRNWEDVRDEVPPEQRLTFGGFVDHVLSAANNSKWAEWLETFRMLQAAGQHQQHPVVIYLQYHPPFTNNPNWQPHGSRQAGDVSQISLTSTIRDEVIEWMDPDSTEWDRHRRTIIGGISWAKLQIPRIVVEMDAITFNIIWPRDAETCVNYRPQDMDLLASAVNKIAKVQEMSREDPQPKRWLWAVGAMIGDAFAPGPMLTADRIERYDTNIEVGTVKGASERYKASLRRPAPPNTQAYKESERRELELQRFFTRPKTLEERRAEKEAEAALFDQPSTSAAAVGARMNTGGGSRKRANPQRVAAHYGASSQ